MKSLILMTSLMLTLSPSSAQAQYGGQVCYNRVYIPEGYDRYGNYHEGHYQDRQVPCNNQQQGVSCDPSRTFLGAILGGGVAASMSRGDGYKWSVPLGAFIGGAGFGCN